MEIWSVCPPRMIWRNAHVDWSKASDLIRASKLGLTLWLVMRADCDITGNGNYCLYWIGVFPRDYYCLAKIFFGRARTWNRLRTRHDLSLLTASLWLKCIKQRRITLLGWTPGIIRNFGKPSSIWTKIPAQCQPCRITMSQAVVIGQRRRKRLEVGGGRLQKAAHRGV